MGYIMRNLRELDENIERRMNIECLDPSTEGSFVLRKDGVEFVIIASSGMGWEHVSVSTRNNRTPSWEEMCTVKRLFFKDDEVVMQLHPAEKDYINDNKFVLHLWRPKLKKIPLPRKDMV
jgi:hypothetical protein